MVNAPPMSTGNIGVKFTPPGEVVVNPKTDPKLVPLTEMDILTDRVSAIPVNDFDLLNPTCADPNKVFHWVNWKSLEGRNVAQRLQQGYVRAKIEDVKGGTESPQAELVKEDGSIKYFDLMLMINTKAKVFGMYKANLIKSFETTENALPNAASAAMSSLTNPTSGTVGPNGQELYKASDVRAQFAQAAKEGKFVKFGNPAEK